jgi:hypothetical protein
MATTFTDSNAWITGQGGLSLGNAGKDDGSGDPAAPYAKGDVWVNVPLNQLIMGAGAIGAPVRASAGLYSAAITAAAATQIVTVPITGLFRKYAGSLGGPGNPHGFKLTDLVFVYTIATAGETSIAVAFFTVVDTNAVARASVATPFGAVTYENPIGTVVANPPVATQATPYVVRAVPAAPIFVNADNTDVYAEISFVNPGTAVAALTHVGYHVSMALY